MWVDEKAHHRRHLRNGRQPGPAFSLASTKKNPTRGISRGTSGRVCGRGHRNCTGGTDWSKGGVALERARRPTRRPETNDLITRIDDTAGPEPERYRQENARRAPDKVMPTIFRKDESRTFPVGITRKKSAPVGSQQGHQASYAGPPSSFRNGRWMTCHKVNRLQTRASSRGLNWTFTAETRRSA
jgi:hypothetical protein